MTIGPSETFIHSSNLKRRQILSRDRSKRHSTTLLDSKFNGNFLKNNNEEMSADTAQQHTPSVL